MELVTIADARNHLRLDTGTADDAWLAIFIPAISEAVANWVKDPWRIYIPSEDSDGIITDSNGDPIPAEPLVAKWSVKAAVLLELANVYRNREGEGTDNVMTPDAGYGYVLNKASTALLTPLRRPTVR